MAIMTATSSRDNQRNWWDPGSNASDQDMYEELKNKHAAINAYKQREAACLNASGLSESGQRIYTKNQIPGIIATNVTPSIGISGITTASNGIYCIGANGANSASLARAQQLGSSAQRPGARDQIDDRDNAKVRPMKPVSVSTAEVEA